jgi:hypothetical protein
MKVRRGELVKVGSLFEKYAKTLKPPQRSVEKMACEVIEAIVGCVLTSEQVSYTVSTRTLYVKAPALLRSEIKLHSNEILEVLRDRLPKEPPLVLL